MAFGGIGLVAFWGSGGSSMSSALNRAGVTTCAPGRPDTVT
ncbi:hypothetical protein [Streptomyces sp. SID486]|nr:hypothetical protein [Streptomyces sp. SID486]